MIDETPRQLLSAYLDDELSPSERADVEQLLETSPEAQRELDELQVVGEWLRRIPRESLPATFPKHVLDNVSAEAKAHQPQRVADQPTSPKSWKSWVPICAAVAVVGLAVKLFFPNAETRSAPEIASAESNPADVGDERGDRANPPALSAADKQRGRALGTNNTMLAESEEGAAILVPKTESLDKASAIADRFADSPKNPKLSSSELKEADVTDDLRIGNQDSTEVAVVQIAVSDRDSGRKKLRALFDQRKISSFESSENSPDGGVAILVSLTDEEAATTLSALREESSFKNLRLGPNLALADVQSMLNTQKRKSGFTGARRAMSFGGGGSDRPSVTRFGGGLNNGADEAKSVPKPASVKSAENAASKPFDRDSKKRKPTEPSQTSPPKADPAPAKDPAQPPRLTTAGAGAPAVIRGNRFRQTAQPQETPLADPGDKRIAKKDGIAESAEHNQPIFLPPSVLKELQQQAATFENQKAEADAQVDSPGKSQNRRLKIVFVLVEQPDAKNASPAKPAGQD